MTRVTRKQLLKQDEFAESAADIGDWLEQHWRKLLVGIAALVALGLLVTGSFWMARERREAAEQRFGAAVSSYLRAEETGFTDRAATDAALAKLTEVADEDSGTRQQVGRYYQAATLLRLGRAEDALARLETLVGRSDLEPTLEGSAKALLARVLEEAGQPERAMEVLQELANRPDAGYPAQQALLELGRLQVEAGDLEAARATWQRIIDAYPQSGAAFEARRLIER